MLSKGGVILNYFKPVFGIQARFRRPYHPKNNAIVHPPIPRPTHQDVDWRLKLAKFDGPAQFKPLGYARAANIEKMRMADDLGKDFPYNNLYAEHWAKRRYNTKIEKYPWNVSEVKAIHYAEHLNVFIVQWTEDGIYRFRWFRCAYGRLRAKRAAERFRQKLEALGRVDHMRSDRFVRMKFLEKKKERALASKKFALVISGKMLQ